MLDAYTFFLKNPRYNKLIGDDYLFVEYKCPISKDEIKLWSESNFITYAISGRKDWISDQKVYTLEKGDALFIKKGVYRTKQYFDVDYCVLLFFINDDFIRRFMNENFVKNIELRTNHFEDQIYSIDINDSLNSLLYTVFTYFKQEGPIPKDLIEIKFKELMYNIILNPENSSVVQFFHSLKNQRKTELETVMMQNFQADLKLDEFARLAGRSLSTFKRDFKDTFDESPGKWLNNKRLEYARYLLLNKDLNINEVCYQSGFKNTSHFNKAFKQRYKLPPMKFKKAFTEQ